MKKAIFSPGPSFSDPNVRAYAGWVRILDLYKEGLEECGYDVFVPYVDPRLIDQSSTVSKIESYDLGASMWLRGQEEDPEMFFRFGEGDIFLGPPGYSLSQMMSLSRKVKKFLYVFNCADWWRDQQLAEEYKKFNAFYDLSPCWRWINTTALQVCNHIIACSPWVANTHRQVAGIPHDKVSIAFWGVDSEKFHPPDVEPEGFRALFVGGDPIRKGLHYLIKALEGMGDYELWIVGCRIGDDTELPSNWKQFGMVPHDDMLGIYQQCHVICIPTLEDGIALAIQEGMACGLVPITSPETSEVFEDGEQGYRVGYRDVEAIRERIVILRDNSSRRRKLSREARKLAVSQTWEKTKEEFKEIVRKVEGG